MEWNRSGQQAIGARDFCMVNELLNNCPYDGDPQLYKTLENLYNDLQWEQYLTQLLAEAIASSNAAQIREAVNQCQQHTQKLSECQDPTFHQQLAEAQALIRSPKPAPPQKPPLPRPGNYGSPKPDRRFNIPGHGISPGGGSNVPPSNSINRFSSASNQSNQSGRRLPPSGKPANPCAPGVPAGRPSAPAGRPSPSAPAGRPSPSVPAGRPSDRFSTPNRPSNPGPSRPAPVGPSPIETRLTQLLSGALRSNDRNVLHAAVTEAYNHSEQLSTCTNAQLLSMYNEACIRLETPQPQGRPVVASMPAGTGPSGRGNPLIRQLSEALKSLDRVQLSSALQGVENAGVQCNEVLVAKEMLALNDHDFAVKTLAYVYKCGDRQRFATLLQGMDTNMLQEFYVVQQGEDFRQVKVRLQEIDAIHYDFSNLMSTLKGRNRVDNFANARRTGNKKKDAQLFVWQKSFIQHPLQSFAQNENKKTLNELAKRSFRSILGYMKDKTHRKINPVEFGKDVVEMGYNNSQIRDEVFLQLVKQTRCNPNPASEVLGWKLLFVCLSSFTPSTPPVCDILQSHIANRAEPKIDKYMAFNTPQNVAANCWKAYHRGMLDPSSFQAPNMTLLSQITDEFHEYSASFCAMKMSALDMGAGTTERKLIPIQRPGYSTTPTAIGHTASTPPPRVQANTFTPPSPSGRPQPSGYATHTPGSKSLGSPRPNVPPPGPPAHSPAPHHTPPAHLPPSGFLRQSGPSPPQQHHNPPAHIPPSGFPRQSGPSPPQQHQQRMHVPPPHKPPPRMSARVPPPNSPSFRPPPPPPEPAAPPPPPCDLGPPPDLSTPSATSVSQGGGGGGLGFLDQIKAGTELKPVEIDNGTSEQSSSMMNLVAAAMNSRREVMEESDSEADDDSDWDD